MSTSTTWEPIGDGLARTAASSYQRGLPLADKQLTAEEIRGRLPQLPVLIAQEWEYAVVGYIQHFGWSRVQRWAAKAADKRDPERWLMTVMRRERYGK